MDFHQIASGVRFRGQNPQIRPTKFCFELFQKNREKKHYIFETLKQKSPKTTNIYVPFSLSKVGCGPSKILRRPNRALQSRGLQSRLFWNFQKICFGPKSRRQGTYLDDFLMDFHQIASGVRFRGQNGQIRRFYVFEIFGKLDISKRAAL